MAERVTIFGAGAVGRGLVAELVSAAGLKPVFVEAKPELVRDLKRSGEYRVYLVGKKRRNSHIGNFEVFTISQTDEISEAISNCLFAATAGGSQDIAGADSVAVTFPLFEAMCNHPLTSEGLAAFTGFFDNIQQS